MKKGTLALVATVAGGLAGSAATYKMTSRNTNRIDKKVDKFKGYYNMLNQWLMIKQEGKSLDEYFVKNGYEKIAIYGMGEMGNRLYDELKNTNIEIKYVVDKEAARTYSELEVIDKDELRQQEMVDVMVVTATFAYEDIEKEISSLVDCPIVSLDDVVYEL